MQFNLDSLQSITIEIISHGWLHQVVSKWRINYMLTSLKESYFSAGSYWNLLDGKSPHSFNNFISEGACWLLAISVHERQDSQTRRLTHKNGLWLTFHTSCQSTVAQVVVQQNSSLKSGQYFSASLKEINISHSSVIPKWCLTPCVHIQIHVFLIWFQSHTLMWLSQ